MRWRNAIYRTALAGLAVACCVLVGIGLAELDSDQTQVLQPALNSINESNVAAEVIPTTNVLPKPAPSIIILPPDTFSEELAETNQLLDELHRNWHSPADEVSQPVDDWRRGLDELRQMIPH